VAEKGSTAETQCTRCPEGTYQALEGASTCVYCARGTWNPVEGRSVCLDCAAGTYQTKTGQFLASACVDCVAGTWSHTHTHTHKHTHTHTHKHTHTHNVQVEPDQSDGGRVMHRLPARQILSSRRQRSRRHVSALPCGPVCRSQWFHPVFELRSRHVLQGRGICLRCVCAQLTGGRGERRVPLRRWLWLRSRCGL
jgi:hypothetical protein